MKKEHIVMVTLPFLLFVMLMCTPGPSVAQDQDVPLLNLPEGAKVLISEGTINVLSISFSPDGNTLASGCDDGTIRLWNVGTGDLRYTLKEHTDSVSSISYSPDGNTLASGCDDGTIRLWNVGTGDLRYTLKGHRRSVPSVAFSSDGNTLASGSYDNTVRLWDVGTGDLRHTLKGHTDGVSSVAFSSDGSTLASGSFDSTIRLWNVGTGDLRHTLKGHTSSVHSVAFSSDGNTFASGSDDKTIRLWNAETSEPRHTLKGHTSSVPSVAFSSDGSMLASGSYDSTIHLWDVGTGDLRHTLKGHTSFWSVVFSPDGNTLASVSQDGTVLLWDVTSYYDEKEEPVQISEITGPWLWMIAPTFEVNGAAATNIDSLTKASGGNVTEVYIALNGAQEGDVVGNYAWTSGVLPENGSIHGVLSNIGMVDVNEIVNNHSSYALITLVSEADQNDVKMKTGSDDSIKVWLNGTVVFTNAINRGLAYEYEDEFTVNLKKGENLLLVKVSNGGGGWGMRVGIAADVTLKLPTLVDAPTAPVEPPPDPVEEPIDISPSLTGYGYLPDEHTLGLWHFDGENITDASKNAIAGVAKGKAEWSTNQAWHEDAESGHSFSFDGETFITFGHAEALIPTTALTVEAWVFLQDLTSYHLICTNWPGAYHLGTWNGIPQFEVDTDQGYVNLRAPAQQKLELGKWYHVAGTYDSSQVKLYLNGVEVASTELSGELNDSGSDVIIGSKHNGRFKWIGLIDEVRISSIARQSEELSPNLAAPPITPKPTYPAWDVNQDGHVNILDLVSVSQHIGKSASAAPHADVNGDSNINILDLVLVANHLGETTSDAAPANVPKLERVDPALVEGWLTLAQIENDGSLLFQQGIANLERLLASLIPRKTALLANYPNPFNPETWIPYQLSKPADVKITIYAADGKLVRTLTLGHQAAGIYQSRSHAAHWDGKNESGESVASGIYFYKFTAGDFSATRKMLIRK